MEFDTNYKKINLIGEAQYLKNENSFFYEPWNNVDFSIIIGNSYSSLDVKLSNMKVVQLTGFNSKDNWIEKKIDVPKAMTGELLIKGKQGDFCTGSGIHCEETWETYYNPDNGWICIGNYEYCKTGQAVKFANNTVAVIKGTKLWAIWINPKFIEE